MIRFTLAYIVFAGLMFWAGATVGRQSISVDGEQLYVICKNEREKRIVQRFIARYRALGEIDANDGKIPASAGKSKERVTGRTGNSVQLVGTMRPD